MKRLSVFLSVFLIVSLALTLVHPVFAAYIFETGFETEDCATHDFCEWTGTSGSPNVQSTVKKQGTYAMEAAVSTDYAYKTFTGQTTVYARVYARLEDLFGADGQYIRFLRFFGGANHIASVGFYRGTGNVHKIELYRVYPDHVFTYYDFNYEADVWYCFELKFVRASSPNGEYRVWLDGEEIISDTGLDTTGVAEADALRVGYVYGTAGTLQIYVDCVVVDSSYIGPEEEEEEEFTEEFSETISVSASLYRWRALFYKQVEGITTTATAYSWKEKTSFYTETTVATTQQYKWKELTQFFTETTLITETSSFTKELIVEIMEFVETIKPDASLFLWKAKQFLFIETIDLSTTFYKWIELSQMFVETVTTSETLELLKEKLLIVTEAIEVSASLIALKEVLLTFIEFSELIQFDADMILTFALIAPEIEVTTFGTVAFVIAIIALAIAVTTFTAKKS